MGAPTTTSSSASCARSLLPLLRKALDELESTIIDKKDIKRWEAKREMLLDSYSEYVRSLDYHGTEYVGYATRYINFLEQLESNASRFALHP
jgi:hypothetical protein